MKNRIKGLCKLKKLHLQRWIAMFTSLMLIVGMMPVSVISAFAENSKNSQTTMASAIWDGTIADSYSSGDGSSGSPFVIETASQLARLAQQINNGTESGKYYKLASDIYLNDITYIDTWNLVAPQNKWTPIGTTEQPFSGTLYGNDHIIYGLYISTEDDYQGLFGSLEQRSIIEKVGVEQSYIKGGNYVGAVCGLFKGRSSWGRDALNDCHSGSTVIGEEYVGGVLGAYGSEGDAFGFEINRVYNTGNVKGTNYVGGIIGRATTGYIGNCYNAGNVEGTSCVGGIAGASIGSYQCWNAGAITGTTKVGGIFGEGTYYGGSSSYIKNSFNAGSIFGESFTGGLLGYSTVYSGYYPSEISNCYNVGELTGTGDYVGGIAGQGWLCKYINCYNAGTCSLGSGSNTDAVFNYGARSETENCYYLDGCCGEDYENGWPSRISAKTADEMKSADFATALGSAWKQDENGYNSGYPILTGIDYEVYSKYINNQEPGTTIFDPEIYRANRLIDISNVETATMKTSLSEDTPCEQYISLLQQNGFGSLASTWTVLTTAFDAVDDPTTLYDFAFEEKDIYSAIILKLLETSTNYGVVDACDAVIKDAKEGVSEINTILKIDYKIEAYSGYDWGKLTDVQAESVKKCVEDYYKQNVQADIASMDKVFSNFGKALDVADCLETYLEKVSSAIAMTEMSESLKTVLKTMYAECPDSNVAMRLALLDCVDIVDSSTDELIAKLETEAFSVVGVEISQYLVKELWKEVKAACNLGFPALDILLAGYKTGKFVSNALFSTDSTIEQYYVMLATVSVENLMTDVCNSLATTHSSSSTRETASAYLSAIDVMFTSRIEDCSAAYDFVDVTDDALINQIGAIFDRTGANQRNNIKSSINETKVYYNSTHSAVLTQWINFLEEDYPDSGLYEYYSVLYKVGGDLTVTKKYTVACPVDVYVYDSTNRLIAYVIDNRPYCAGNLTVLVTDDVKEFYFYDSEEYRIEFIGNDIGKMDLKITDYNADESEAGTAYFYDIDLYDGKSYVMKANVQTITGSAFSLVQTNNEKIYPDLDTNLENGKKYTVKINSGSMIIDGELCFETEAQTDESISIYAYVPVGYQFKGWTSDLGTDIFEDATSRITTLRVPSSDVTINAILIDSEGKTHKVPSSVTFTASSSSLIGSGTVTLTPSLPSDATGTVTITCSDSSVTITDNGNGTYSAYLQHPGTYTFTVVYAGDENHESATVTCVVTVSEDNASAIPSTPSVR